MWRSNLVDMVFYLHSNREFRDEYDDLLWRSFKVTQGQLQKETHYLKALFEHVVYVLTASTSVQDVNLKHGYIV